MRVIIKCRDKSSVSVHPVFNSAEVLSMAVVQALQTMTLEQTNKILYMVQNNQNCVINTTLPQQKMMAKRPLAPAPQKGTVLVNNNDVLRCKRKINFAPYGGAPHQPASVARRNARERNRVKQVNNGFATLRQHIPPSVAAALSSPTNTSTRSANKKLSKVETLRLAVEYIRSLQRMIEDYEAKVPTGAGKLTGENISRYYPTQVDVQLQQQSLTTPPCSEASSPTPSFSSESSVSVSSSYVQTALYSTENYENYEPTSPEDEELLDAISWWQQQ